jgi:hypothetical protein
VHEVQVNIVKHEIFQRRVNTLLHTLVPRVVELGGDPDFVPWHPGVLDSLANFMLIAICERAGALLSLGVPFTFLFKLYSRVDVAITSLQRNFDCFSNLVGLRLPRSETNTRHLVPSVEGEDLPVNGESVRWSARGTLVLTWSLDQLRTLSWWMGIQMEKIW